MMQVKNPVIEDWQLFFKNEHGKENRIDVINAFTKFFFNADEKEIVFIVDENEEEENIGKCMFGGKVFGHDAFDNGDEIFTSPIKHIKRIGSEKLFELYEAKTVSNNFYYFYSDEYSANMAKMLVDFLKTGTLNPEDGYYLNDDLKGTDLL